MTQRDDRKELAARAERPAARQEDGEGYRGQAFPVSARSRTKASLAGCLAALLLASGTVHAEGTSPAAGQSASRFSPAEQWQECRARWDADEARGITHGTALFDGALTVLIDESTWSGMDREEREAMIATLECAFAGPGGTLLRADFREVRSDEILAEWRDGELYRPGSNLPLD